VARRVERGDIWLYQFRGPDKRRPVVVLTRNEVLGLLSRVIVAPVTSTIHGAPGEVEIGVAEGLKHPSAANLDAVQTVERSRLSRWVGRVSPEKMRAICRALSIATGCDA
jgi:mRNA interferase MazF